MIAKEAHSQARKRRPARDLIAAVLENMRHNLEPMKYSTLAPSRYIVYVHPAEFARLEGIIPLLREETARALTDEIGHLNSRSRIQQYRERILGDGDPPVQSASGSWHIDFLPDADGELAEGDILIESELLLPAHPELGAGARTRRISTVHVGQSTTVRQHTIDDVSAPAAAAGRAYARIVYEDNAGHHTYDISQGLVTIGRGGSAYPVDVRIVSSVDVSREHARLRRDEVSGRFFLIDLSSLGTTLNGRHVPRGYDEVNGTRRENGVETPLPERARIGLAETVFLDFSVIATGVPR